MAENEIKQVIKIEGDAQSVKELKKQIQDIKDTMVQYLQQGKDISDLQGQLTKKNDILAKALGKQKQSIDSATGSFNDLNNKLKEAKERWKAAAPDTEEWKLANEQVKGLKEQINTLNEGIGNYQANVGNYTGALEEYFGPSRQKIRQLREELAKLEVGTEAYNAKLQELGTVQRAYQDSMDDAKRASADFGDRMGVVAEAQTNLNGIFQSTIGIFALMGAESQDLAKIWGVFMAGSSLIQGILNGLDGFGKAMNGLKLTFSNNIKQIKLFVKSLNGVKAAIAATGIGLLVVALGTLIAYWDDVSKAIFGTNDEMEKYRDISDKVSESIAAQNSLLEHNIRLMSAQGASLEEIKNERIKALDAQKREIKATIDQIKADRAALVAKTGLLKTGSWFSGNRKAIKEMDEQMNALLKQAEDVEKSIADVEQKYATDSAIEKINADKKAAEEAKRTAEQNAKDRKAIEERLYDDQTELAIRKRKEQYDRELELFKDNLQAQRQLTEEYYKDLDSLMGFDNSDAGIRQADTEAYQSSMTGNSVKNGEDVEWQGNGKFTGSTQADLEEWKNERKIYEEEYERQVEAQQRLRKEAIEEMRLQYDAAMNNGDTEGADALLEQITATGNKIIEVDNTVAEVKKQNIADVEEATDRMMEKQDSGGKKWMKNMQKYGSVTSNILSTLGNAADKETKEGFEMWKVTQQAQNAISTVVSSIEAYQSLATVPLVGPALGAAAAAAVVAAGAQNAANIEKQKFDSYSSVDSSYGGASVQAPSTALADWNPNLTRNMLTDEETDNLYNRQYSVSVVDINNMQNKVKVRDTNSTF